MRVITCLIILALFCLVSIGQVKEKFNPGIHHYHGTTIPFQLFKPSSYDGSQHYPLILYLHGASSRGADNVSQLKRPPVAFFASDQIQTRHPSFILAPQCPSGEQWVDFPWEQGGYFQNEVHESNELNTVKHILDSIIKQYPVDTNRVYCIGESMGGYGTWDMATRYPNKFAAIIPVVGAGDPSKMHLIKHLGIWGFHGTADDLVPVSGTRNMFKALDSLDSDILYTHCDPMDCMGKSKEVIETMIISDAPPLHIYSEFEDRGHEIWSAYMCEFYGLMDWLFSFSKPDTLKREEAP